MAAAARDMAAGVFAESAPQLDGRLLALEQSTVAARRSEVGVRQRSRGWRGAWQVCRLSCCCCIAAHCRAYAAAHMLLPRQGLRLYWLALERLVAAEGFRPGSSPGAAASLLAAPLFHKCVAACAFEVVAAAYRMVRGGGGWGGWASAALASLFRDAWHTLIGCSRLLLPCCRAGRPGLPLRAGAPAPAGL